MSESSDGRLFSLDLLRGLDMFLLTVVGPFVMTFDSAVGIPHRLLGQFRHQWGVFGLWDIIMPLFIFICGAAVPFALGKRMVEGRTTPDYWKHVLVRFFFLWFLGLVAQGRLLTLDLSLISPFNNTLQSIASGYLIAAVVFPLKKRIVRLLIPIALVVVYAVLLHFGGDYTPTGNFAQQVEDVIVPLLTPKGSRVLELADPGYTWWLTTLMFGGMTLCGMESSRILMRKDDGFVRFRTLLIMGLSLLIVGWLLIPWVPSIKHIYTITFTAQAMGYSCLLLAILYWLTDILRLRRGLGLFILFGRHALFAYMVVEVFVCVPDAFGAFAMQGVRQLFGEAAFLFSKWLAGTILLIGAMRCLDGGCWRKPTIKR